MSSNANILKDLRDAFSMGVNEETLWKDVFQRLEKPPLYREQMEGKPTAVVFLCANWRALPTVKAQAEKFFSSYKIVDVETAYLTEVDDPNCSTSHWILIAALYHQVDDQNPVQDDG